MNKLLLSSISLLFVFGACVGLPKPTTAEDCLIIMKVNKTGDVVEDDIREYFFSLSDEKTFLKVSPADDFVFFVIREPGIKINRIITDLSEKARKTWKGQRSSYEVNYNLPYIAGGAVIIDHGFEFKSINQVLTAQRNVSITFDFVKISQNEKKDLLKKLESDKTFAEWQVN